MKNQYNAITCLQSVSLTYCLLSNFLLSKIWSADVTRHLGAVDHESAESFFDQYNTGYMVLGDNRLLLF